MLQLSQDILHPVFLQLTAVIRVTFTPILLNFTQMLELVGSYLHDFVWPQCLLLWLDNSLRKVIIAGHLKVVKLDMELVRF